MKTAILEQGFEVLKGFVPPALVVELLQTVKAVRENPSHFTENFQEGELHWDSRLNLEVLPESIQHVVEMVQSALKSEISDVRFHEAQLSIFYPGHSGWTIFHLDGAGQIFRGERTFDDLSDFSLIVGVALVDLTEPNRGNLVVVPEGPKLVAEWFRKNQETLPENPLRGACQQFQEGSAQPLLLEPGDVAVLHYAMPHRVDSNEFAPRPMLYLRFGKPSIHGIAAYLDPKANF